MCALLLNFLELLSSAPLERYVCSCWQWGGGLDIVGTAMLTDTNLYENQASNVRSLLHFP